MNTTNMEALVEQNETEAEKFLRNVLMKEGDCRFSMEVRLSNKTVRHYNLHAVSKPTALFEAEHFLDQLLAQSNEDRIMWRIPGVACWTVMSKQTANTVSPKHVEKKQSWFSSFIERYFFIDEE